MGSDATTLDELTDFGRLLRHWRHVRQLSQLHLASVAGVSARHISFLETGRSLPSREMVLTLSDTLDVPLRQRNALLQIAGHAPIYRETPLHDPRMADTLRAVRLVLRQHGPLGGAVALDRRWDVVMANEAYTRLVRLLLCEVRCPVLPFELTPAPRTNILRQVFDPDGIRRHIVNWDAVARSLLLRVQLDAAASGEPAVHELVREVLGYPGVPEKWREVSFEGPEMVTRLELRLPRGVVRMFSTMTTLGAPRDITVEELRIDSFQAADEASEDLIRAALASA
jgi:transcriptional regulator with XRE-family HTH domain